MKQVFIADGARTPIGKTGGILQEFLPEQLAASVLNGIIDRNGLSPDAIDQVILGNVVGPGGNIARVAVLEAGWPYSIPALTVDLQCGSGLSAINMAAALIQSGQAEMVIAGGVESTSMAPRRQFNANDPRFQGEAVYYEQAPFSPAAIGNPDTGEAAENLAGQLDISREDMDLLALESHRRASLAREQGLLSNIIIPLGTPSKPIIADECVRENMRLKLLERMPPAFRTSGRITAGNTCLKHDGAAAVLLASETALAKYRLQPQAIFAGAAASGWDPNRFPLSPVGAIEKLLSQTRLPLTAIDRLEINEAFAVKILACCRELGYSLEQTNTLGGALAYGHPYGASGAIILLHLIKALQQANGRFGIAAIGAVGGMGVASLIERC